MSFNDIYTVPPGGDVAPGLPPIDLPKVPGGRPPLRVTITKPITKPAPDDGAWGSSVKEFTPAPAAQSSKPEDIDGAWAASRADHSPETEAAAKTLHREVSGGEAFLRSVAAGATFGGAPALEGVAAASGKPIPTATAADAGAPPYSRRARFALGATNLMTENALDPLLGINPGGVSGLVTGDSTGPATKAYRKARDAAEATLEEGREQHPGISFAGEVAGGMLTPLPGVTAGSLGARLARGAIAGGAGGAAYGAGSAISQGKDWSDVVIDAATSGAVGAGVGSAFGGILGPRVAGTNTPGQRAAQTARDLGAPLPRGVASDSRAVQATTSKLRQVPFAGERIGRAVDATQEAAGRRIGQIAAGAAGVAPDRALAGARLRPALQGVIDDNMGLIDRAYDGLRSQINAHLYGPTRRTATAVNAVIRQRRGQRVANPEAGYGDLLNLIRSGISFNSMQRARNALGRMIDFHETNPHPGFDVRDLRRIYAAMSGDMEDIVRQHALGNPAQAVNALRGANAAADTIIDQNRAIQRVLNVQGESLVGSLVTAAQERTGNLQILANLRASMPTNDFHNITGVMLSELGHNNATNEFSLNQFVRNWDRVSQGARNIMFSPQHLQNIEDIVAMGRHIRGALRESSTSHSASLLVMLDIAKDAALLGADVASGGIGAGTAIGAGTSAGLWMLTRWLGNPAQASSMRRWLQAHQNLIISPTPARAAAFQIATRNLSYNLGISLEDIAKHLVPQIPASSDTRTDATMPAKSQDRMPALAR